MVYTGYSCYAQQNIGTIQIGATLNYHELNSVKETLFLNFLVFLTSLKLLTTFPF